MPGGYGVLAGAVATSLRPRPDVAVDIWADQHRHIAAESGSPYPGRWSTERAPYLREPMRVLSVSDPARDVVFVASAQSGKSEVGVNWFGYLVDVAPGPTLIVQSSLDEMSKYNRVKLDPTIKASPTLKAKVKEQRTSQQDGSTAFAKKFAGGFCQLTGANSSKGLQMISAKYGIFEEISEWPDEAGERGDPLAQAEARFKAFSERGYKRLYVSTPGIKGGCRITAKYEASDQRRYYVPCPHCGTYQSLAWDRMHWDSDERPHGAYMACRAHGCVIETRHKAAMVAQGVWLKTYPGEDAPPWAVAPEQLDGYHARSSRGREPGFHVWQAYSPFVSWDDTVAEWLAAKGTPRAEMVFAQQCLGEAWEPRGEAPDHQLLHRRREDYPPRQVPPGGLVVTGFADVQSNRLEFGIYAWGVGFERWLIDWGVLEGDPGAPEVWARLDDVTERTYPDCNGNIRAIEVFGVDAGYHQSVVAGWATRRERSIATKGMPQHTHPLLGTPIKVDVTRAGKKMPRGGIVWPLGSWPAKYDTYAAIRKLLETPEDSAPRLGALHLPGAVDEAYCRQLTAEYLRDREQRDGRIVREWVKPSGQANEALDIAAGNRAMAYHLGLDHLTAQQWHDLAAAREAPPEAVQPSLSALWAPPPKAEAAQQAETVADIKRKSARERAREMARRTQQ